MASPVLGLILAAASFAARAAATALIGSPAGAEELVWIDAIGRSADQPMLMTADQEHQCPLCNYRSFCERGLRAGAWADGDGDVTDGGDLPSIDFDFHEIEEIEF